MTYWGKRNEPKHSHVTLSEDKISKILVSGHIGDSISIEMYHD